MYGMRKTSVANWYDENSAISKNPLTRSALGKTLFQEYCKLPGQQNSETCAQHATQVNVLNSQRLTLSYLQLLKSHGVEVVDPLPTKPKNDTTAKHKIIIYSLWTCTSVLMNKSSGLLSPLKCAT